MERKRLNVLVCTSDTEIINDINAVSDMISEELKIIYNECSPLRSTDVIISDNNTFNVFKNDWADNPVIIVGGTFDINNALSHALFITPEMIKYLPEFVKQAIKKVARRKNVAQKYKRTSKIIEKLQEITSDTVLERERKKFV